MERDELERYARAALAARRELLWNPQGTWPDDTGDPRQAPHGRPVAYWVGTVAGCVVAQAGRSGWSTRGEAIEAARRFRARCREALRDAAGGGAP